jgi:hypothetical protein
MVEPDQRLSRAGIGSVHELPDLINITCSVQQFRPPVLGVPVADRRGPANLPRHPAESAVPGRMCVPSDGRICSCGGLGRRHKHQRLLHWCRPLVASLNFGSELGA